MKWRQMCCTAGNQARLANREATPSCKHTCISLSHAPSTICTHHAAVGALQRVQALRCGRRFSAPHVELASGTRQAGLDGGNCSAGRENLCGRDDSRAFFAAVGDP